jgi:hypothetical protein
MDLLVPGGRVLNPQSYHSAFRISSTRHEEAHYNGPFLTLISLGTKNLVANLNRDRLSNPGASECHREGGRRSGLHRAAVIATDNHRAPLLYLSFP